MGWVGDTPSDFPVEGGPIGHAAAEQGGVDKVKGALHVLDAPDVGGEVDAGAKGDAEVEVLHGRVLVPDVDGDDLGLGVLLRHLDGPDAGAVTDVEDAQVAGSQGGDVEMAFEGDIVEGGVEGIEALLFRLEKMLDRQFMAGGGGRVADREVQ